MNRQTEKYTRRKRWRSAPLPLKMLIFKRMTGICAQLVKSKNLGVKILRNKDVELDFSKVDRGLGEWVPKGLPAILAIRGAQSTASRKHIHRNRVKHGLVVQPKGWGLENSTRKVTVPLSAWWLVYPRRGFQK